MENYLSRLLEKNNRVIVPDLGAFILRQQDPKELVFNDLLAFDDGMLTERLIQEENLSKAEANSRIKEFVEKLKSVLQKGDSYTLENLGTLTMDASGRITLQALTAEEKETASGVSSTPKEADASVPVRHEEKVVPEEATDAGGKVETEEEEPKKARPEEAGPVAAGSKTAKPKPSKPGSTKTQSEKTKSTGSKSVKSSSAKPGPAKTKSAKPKSAAPKSAKSETAKHEPAKPKAASRKEKDTEKPADSSEGTIPEPIPPAEEFVKIIPLDDGDTGRFELEEEDAETGLKSGAGEDAGTDTKSGAGEGDVEGDFAGKEVVSEDAVPELAGADKEEPPFQIEEAEEEAKEEIPDPYRSALADEESPEEGEVSIEELLASERNKYKVQVNGVPVSLEPDETNVSGYYNPPRRRRAWPWVIGFLVLVAAVLLAGVYLFPEKLNRILPERMSQRLMKEEPANLFETDQQEAGEQSVVPDQAGEEGPAEIEDQAFAGDRTEEGGKAESPTAVPGESTAPGKKYYIVAGCFADLRNAENYVRTLRDQGYPASIFGKRNNLHAVCFSSYASRQAASEELSRIRRNVDPSAWLLYY